MKKLVALAIVIVIISALSIPAVATVSVSGDASAPVSATTKITYNVAETFIFSTPAKLIINEKTGNLAVTKCNILPTSKIRVSVSAPTWKLGGCTYAINGVSSDGVIVEFTRDCFEVLEATFVDEAPTRAGEYSETVTFTATIVPKD